MKKPFLILFSIAVITLCMGSWVALNANYGLPCITGSGEAAATSCKTWADSAFSPIAFDKIAQKRRAALSIELDNNDDVISATDSLIKMGAASGMDYWTRGIANYEIGNSELSLNDLTKAKVTIRDNDFLDLDIGNVLLDLEMYKNVQDLASELLQKSTENEGALRLRARAAYFLEDYDTAKQDYDAAILKTENAQWITERGYVHEALHLEDLALKDYSKAISLWPEHAQYYLNRADLLSYQGEYEKALPDLAKAASIDRSAANLTSHADCLISLSRYEEAQKIIEEALKLDAGSAFTTTIAGRLAMEKDDLKGAEAKFLAALKLDKDYANANYWLAILRGRQSLWQDEINILMKLTVVWPRNAPIYNHMGKAWLELDNSENALAAFTKAVALDPNYPSAFENLARTNLRLSKWQTAIDNANSSLKLDDKREVAFYHRGYAFMQLGKTDDALRDLNKAIELDPEFRAAYEDRADLYTARNQIDLALKDFEKAVSMPSRTAETFRVRGRIEEHRKRFDDAITFYNKALEVEPDNIFALEDRAWSKIFSGHLVQAYDDCQELVKHAALVTNGYRCRARANYELGNYEQSLADLNRSLELDPKSDSLLYERGYVYLALNQYDQAIADYSTLITRNYRIGESHLYRGIAKEKAEQSEAALLDYQKALDLADRDWAPDAAAHLRNLKAKLPQDPVPKDLTYPQRRSLSQRG
jgi:tetratricopeptide (TPR) repeat protein